METENCQLKTAHSGHVTNANAHGASSGKPNKSCAAGRSATVCMVFGRHTSPRRNAPPAESMAVKSPSTSCLGTTRAAGLLHHLAGDAAVFGIVEPPGQGFTKFRTDSISKLSLILQDQTIAGMGQSR